MMLAASLMAGGARAQAGAVNERVRLVTDETRRQAAPPSNYFDLAKQEENQIDVGGWVTVTGLDFRDDDHNAKAPDTIRNVVIEDYRLWVGGEITDDLRFYLRGRKQNFDFSTAAGVPQPDFKSQEDVDLDLGYIDWAFAKNFSLRAGRQFVYLGRALTLSADLDGGGLTYADGPWQHHAFVGTSISRDPNIDTSVVGFTKRTQDRDFYIADTSYRFESGTRAYGYLMVQQDASKSLSAAQSKQDFHYDSVYGGVGAEGSLDQLLHYYAEFVYEGGNGLADVPNKRISIDANAFLGGLLWYPESNWHPLVSLEVAHGSGDAARSSVTNTFGGKLTPTSDHNFLYFGSYDGGLALSPRLSNINIVRLGYQVKPFPHEGRQLPGLLVGSKISEYWKDENNGVISDPLATLATSYVGWGVDAFVGYKPFSDLSFLLQYGRFKPGNAYAAGAQDATNRILLTSTLSF